MHHAIDLSRILREMGKTADDVALTLRTVGIQGVRNTVRFLNPIVRYCQVHVRLDHYALDIMQPGIMRILLPDNMNEQFSLPLPVQEFLDSFNAGSYPDLELPTH
jgi:hypothetical protein